MSSMFQTAIADVGVALDVAAEAQRDTGLGGAVAAEILVVAKAAVAALQRIATGNVTPEQAASELDALKAGLAANDAAADAALAARFPG